MGKKQNLNWARNMDVDDWRERQINKWTHRYIEELDQAFRQRHAQDSDETLRVYVQRKARAMGRMPHPLDIPGGLYLRKRLGDWDALALSFGLAPVGKTQGDKAYRRLRKKGEELFLQARRERKREAAQKKELRGQTG